MAVSIYRPFTEISPTAVDFLGPHFWLIFYIVCSVCVVIPILDVNFDSFSMFSGRMSWVCKGGRLNRSFHLLPHLLSSVPALIIFAKGFSHPLPSSAVKSNLICTQALA